MKAFFEEYGLVLVVTVVVAGMLFMAESFKEDFKARVDDQWNKITVNSEL